LLIFTRDIDGEASLSDRAELQKQQAFTSSGLLCPHFGHCI
jgi:hypothetical protein